MKSIFLNRYFNIFLLTLFFMIFCICALIKFVDVSNTFFYLTITNIILYFIITVISFLFVYKSFKLSNFNIITNEEKFINFSGYVLSIISFSLLLMYSFIILSKYEYNYGYIIPSIIFNILSILLYIFLYVDLIFQSSEENYNSRP